MAKNPAAEYTDEHIVTLTGMEHVRRFPGMYIRSPDTPAAQVQICKEVLDNAMDESTIYPDQQFVIDIVFFKSNKSYQVLICDRGRGIPIGSITACLSDLNTSGKYDSDAYQDTIGTFGVGAKATAGLSKFLCGISCRNEGYGMVQLEQGNVIVDDVVRKKQKPDETGTCVFYEPDPEIFYGIDEFMDGEGFKQLFDLIEFVSVFSANTIFRVSTVNKTLPRSIFKESAANIWKTLHDCITTRNTECIYESKLDGDIKEYVRAQFGISAQSVWDFDEWYYERDRDDPADRLGYKIQLFIPNDFKRYQHRIIGTVNLTKINSVDSFHNKGVVDAIKAFLVEFIEDPEIVEFFKTDHYRLPVAGAVMINYRGAKFEGQTKDEFKDRNFLQQYRSMLFGVLKQYPPTYWEELYAILEEDIDVKFRKHTDRDVRVAKGVRDIRSLLHNPKTYIDCSSNDPTITEVFITEGESAGDAMRYLRNTETQAIVKSRGKPPNAMKMTDAQLRANHQASDLMKIIGVTPSDRNLDNMRFCRINILTDADHDGHHIASLYQAMLYRINPLLISEQRVNIITPPLYSVTIRTETLFPRDIHALKDMQIDDIFFPAIKLRIVDNVRGLNVELDAEQSHDFFYFMFKVGDIISHVANQSDIEPMLLQQLLYVVDYIGPNPDVEMINKILGYDRVMYDEQTGSLILCEGRIELPISLHNLQQRMRSDILPTLDLVPWRDLSLYVTAPMGTMRDELSSIMELYYICTVDRHRLYDVSRFKGLSEMDEDQLEVTCVNPETRGEMLITEIGDVDLIYAALGVDTAFRKTLVSKF